MTQLLFPDSEDCSPPELSWSEETYIIVLILLFCSGLPILGGSLINQYLPRGDNQDEEEAKHLEIVKLEKT